MRAIQLRGLHHSDIVCSPVAAVFVGGHRMVGDFRTSSYVEWLTDLAMFRLGRKKETKESHHNQEEEGIRLFGGPYYGPGPRSGWKCQQMSTPVEDLHQNFLE